MRLVCPNCVAQYEVADGTIPESGRDVQCANCNHIWFQDAAFKLSTDDLAQPEGNAPPPEPTFFHSKRAVSEQIEDFQEEEPEDEAPSPTRGRTLPEVDDTVMDILRSEAAFSSRRRAGSTSQDPEEEPEDTAPWGDPQHRVEPPLTADVPGTPPAPEMPFVDSRDDTPNWTARNEPPIPGHDTQVDPLAPLNQPSVTKPKSENAPLDIEAFRARIRSHSVEPAPEEPEELEEPEVDEPAAKEPAASEPSEGDDPAIPEVQKSTREKIAARAFKFPREDTSNDVSETYDDTAAEADYGVPEEPAQPVSAETEFNMDFTERDGEDAEIASEPEPFQTEVDEDDEEAFQFDDDWIEDQIPAEDDETEAEQASEADSDREYPEAEDDAQAAEPVFMGRRMPVSDLAAPDSESSESNENEPPSVEAETGDLESGTASEPLLEAESLEEETVPQEPAGRDTTATVKNSEPPQEDNDEELAAGAHASGVEEEDVTEPKEAAVSDEPPESRLRIRGLTVEPVNPDEIDGANDEVGDRLAQTTTQILAQEPGIPPAPAPVSDADGAKSPAGAVAATEAVAAAASSSGKTDAKSKGRSQDKDDNQPDRRKDSKSEARKTLMQDRKVMLPDVEELNTSLRMEPRKRDINLRASAFSEEQVDGRRKFGLGMVTALLLFAIVWALYLLGPAISDVFPAADPYISALRTTLDSALDRTAQTLEPVVAWLESL